MKKILLVAAICFVSAMYGQSKHDNWSFSTKKINDCEYDLILTCTLDKGWHTFSISKIKGAEKEVFPTEIIFKPGTDYALVGGLEETKPVREYDITIQKNVLLHYDKAVFTQRIRLNSGGKVKISGTYESQVCNNGMCVSSPKHKFDFDLQGVTACSK